MNILNTIKTPSEVFDKVEGEGVKLSKHVRKREPQGYWDEVFRRYTEGMYLKIPIRWVARRVKKAPSTVWYQMKKWGIVSLFDQRFNAVKHGYYSEQYVKIITGKEKITKKDRAFLIIAYILNVGAKKTRTEDFLRAMNLLVRCYDVSEAESLKGIGFLKKRFSGGLMQNERE